LLSLSSPKSPIENSSSIPKDIQTVKSAKIAEPTSLKSPEKPTATIANLVSVLFRLAGLLILIWVVISFVGISNLGLGNLNLGNVLHSNSDTLITQSLPSMALTLNDLPSGWISQGGGGTTTNAYSIQFLKTALYSPGMVKLDITRYSTITEAQQVYNSLKAQSPKYVKIESINVGNEGFGYIDVTDAWAIFRRGNIVVKIEDLRDEYQYFPTINNVKGFAEIVAGRIQ
jgi:hypothetical protein